MKTKKVKGFTLIELIVVLALFTMIMSAALGLLFPIQKSYKNTDEYNAANAVVDTVSEAIESQLRYADRIRFYYGTEYAPTNSQQAWAEEMMNRYNLCGPNVILGANGVGLEGARKTPTTDIIKVMTIHNRVEYVVDGVPSSGYKYPPGRVELNTYKITNNSTLTEYKAELNLEKAVSSYPNAAFNKDYSFEIYFGDGNYTLAEQQALKLNFDCYKNTYKAGVLTKSTKLDATRQVVFGLQNVYNGSTNMFDEYYIYKKDANPVDDWKKNWDIQQERRFYDGSPDIFSENGVNGKDITIVYTTPVRIESLTTTMNTTQNN